MFVQVDPAVQDLIKEKEKEIRDGFALEQANAKAREVKLRRDADVLQKKYQDTMDKLSRSENETRMWQAKAEFMETRKPEFVAESARAHNYIFIFKMTPESHGRNPPIITL